MCGSFSKQIAHVFSDWKRRIPTLASVWTWLQIGHLGILLQKLVTYMKDINNPIKLFFQIVLPKNWSSSPKNWPDIRQIWPLIRQKIGH